MIILRLRSQETMFFKYLDPFGLLSRLSLPGYFALVGIEKDSHGSDYPMALLIANANEERIVIEWICVEPERRYKGFGTQMIEQVINLADDQGIPKVSARFVYENQRGEIAAVAEAFFETIFSEEEALPGEWAKQLGFLLSNPYFKSKASGNIKATPVKDLRRTIVNSPDFPAGSGSYDPDLSTAIPEGDSIQGDFLVQNAGKTCFPFHVKAKSEDDLKALIGSFARNAMDMLDPDTEIRMIPTDDEMADTASKIFASDPIRSKLMTVDVEDVLYE